MMENVFNEAKVSQDAAARVYESMRKDVEELAARRKALDAEHAALKQRYVETCEAEIERARKAFEEAQKKEEKAEEKTELFPVNRKPRARWRGDYAGSMSISVRGHHGKLALQARPDAGLSNEVLGKKETRYFPIPIIPGESYEEFAKRLLDIIKVAIDWRILRNRELLRQSRNRSK